MCTRTVPSYNELGDFVGSVVNRFVGAGKPFTAYEVTQQLRFENPTVEFTRNDVKNVVHTLFKANQINDYQRQSAILQNGKSAFVYFHINDFVTDHTAVMDDGLSPVTVPDLATSSDVDDDEDEDIVEITKESRLNIPHKLLKQVGFNNGDTIYLLYNDKTDNSFFLTCDKPCFRDMSKVVEYVVNKSGELRVSQVHLIKKFGTVSQFYKVTTDTDNTVIEIEPVSHS
jgi:hypothetical protein